MRFKILYDACYQNFLLLVPYLRYITLVVMIVAAGRPLQKRFLSR